MQPLMGVFENSHKYHP